MCSFTVMRVSLQGRSDELYWPWLSKHDQPPALWNFFISMLHITGSFFFFFNFLKPVSRQEKESWLVLSLPNCYHTPDPGSLSWLLLGPHQQNWIASAFFQFLTCRHFAHQRWACSDMGWIAGHGTLPFLHLIWLLCTLPKKLQWHLAGLPHRTLWRHLVTFVSQVHWSYFESCLGSKGQVRCSVIWGLFSEAI